MSARPYNLDPSALPPKGYPPPYDPEMAGSVLQGGFYQPQPFHLCSTAAPVPLVPQPQVVVVGRPPVGSHNARVTCSNCRGEVQTMIQKKPSIVAWISSGLICIFGCICGCCLIPFCVDSCMDILNICTCPNCGAHLGTRRAF